MVPPFLTKLFFLTLVVASAATKHSFAEIVRVRFPVGPGSIRNGNLFTFPGHRVPTYLPDNILFRKWQLWIRKFLVINCGIAHKKTRLRSRLFSSWEVMSRRTS